MFGHCAAQCSIGLHVFVFASLESVLAGARIDLYGIVHHVGDLEFLLEVSPVPGPLVCS